MRPELTLIVTAIPLFGLAGSAIAYVVKLYQDAAERRHRRFFELLQYIDGGGPIAAKLGAVYALRGFPEHAEFVARFCITQREQIVGDNSQALITELNLTAAAVAKRKKNAPNR